MTLAIEIAGALLVGLMLGLLGAGGSILTVPVLTYVVGEPTKVAIAESLLIVGAIALVAGGRAARRGLVDWWIAILLGLPGMLGAFLGAFLTGALSAPTQMLLFAAVLLAAAFRLLTMREPEADCTAPRPPAWQPLLVGCAVGVLTGLVGVGGGFLLVPALVILLRQPIRRAIATSLVIIVANSAIGFATHASALSGSDHSIDWPLVALFVACGIVGTLAGTALSPRLPQRGLRLAFGWMLVAIALATIAVEASRSPSHPSQDIETGTLAG